MGTYSFQHVTASLNGIGGVIPLGYGSESAEEGISVDMVDDKNTMTTGADGAVMHSLHAGKSGTITVRLLKTSPTNQLLSDMYRTQTNNAANHGSNTFTVRDTSRGDILVAQKVAFRKLPPNAFAKNGNVMEWVFDCGMIDQIHGAGN